MYTLKIFRPQDVKRWADEWEVDELEAYMWLAEIEDYWKLIAEEEEAKREKEARDRWAEMMEDNGYSYSPV